MKERLNTEVVNLFKNELTDIEAIGLNEQNITLSLTTENFEQRLGDYLLRMYRLVDERLPEREDHLAIMVKDTSGQYEHVFKIWAPAEADVVI